MALAGRVATPFQTVLFGTDAAPRSVLMLGMAKRTVSTSKNKKPKSTSKRAVARKPAAKAKPSKASTSKKAAAKKAARVKAIEAARVAEQRATTTLNYEPAPFESVADHDPSKAPGNQHRHPPKSLVGVPHSDETIAKARTSFNRRTNIGR